MRDSVYLGYAYLGKATSKDYGYLGVAGHASIARLGLLLRGVHWRTQGHSGDACRAGNDSHRFAGISGRHFSEEWQRPVDI